MPQADTKYFGTLGYGEESVLSFASGPPGFELERSFLLIERPEQHPLVYMQSLSTPDLCFLALPVRAVAPGYQLALSLEDRELLDLPCGDPPAIGADVLCLALVSVPEEGPPTANLLAPVVVNLKTRRALQAVQPDAPYSHRQALPCPDGEPVCS